MFLTGRLDRRRSSVKRTAWQRRAPPLAPRETHGCGSWGGEGETLPSTTWTWSWWPGAPSARPRPGSWRPGPWRPGSPTRASQRRPTASPCLPAHGTPLSVPPRPDQYQTLPPLRAPNSPSARADVVDLRVADAPSSPAQLGARCTTSRDPGFSPGAPHVCAPEKLGHRADDCGRRAGAPRRDDLTLRRTRTLQPEHSARGPAQPHLS